MFLSLFTPSRVNFYQNLAAVGTYISVTEPLICIFPLFYGCIWTVLEHYMVLLQGFVITEKIGSDADSLFTLCEGESVTKGLKIKWDRS